MACTVTVGGRALPCKDALGGIKKVWISEFADSMWAVVGETVDGTIDGLDQTNASATTVKDFDMMKNSGSFTQTVNASIENGTIFYTQVVSCVFSKTATADIEGFADMIKGRLAIIVQDVNDNYFVMGHTRGCEVSGGSVETGTAVGDMNGLKYEFTAEEKIASPFLDKVSAIAETVALTFTPTT